MPKVDVILTQNVVGLGAESDQVKVAAGYARNFLLPHRMAIPVTAVNKRRLEALRQRRGEREAHELNTMTDLAKTLSKLTLVITVKSGEGEKMFGSVTAGTIADELKHQFDVSLDKRKIHLEKPLRMLGDHDVELHLHSDVAATLKVQIKSTNPDVMVPQAPAPAVEAPAKSDRREGRRADQTVEPKTEKKVEAKKAEPKKAEASKEKPEKPEKSAKA
jgi:large subunit ribosomal protein L9